MTTVLLVIHLILCLGLIILVLIQRSEGGALSGLGGGGGGGGGMGGLMSGRSASSLLTRATAVMAGGFMVTSLVLSLLANADRNTVSILDAEEAAATVVEQPKADEPGAPLAK